MSLKSVVLVVQILMATIANSSWANEAQPAWSFVVMGDTRDKTTGTTTGISPDLSRIASAIAAEKPDFVIHTGDLINGYYTDRNSPVHNKFHEMFRNWKTAVQPVYDYGTGKGAPIYLVRGNHEDGKLVTDPKLERAYIEEFAALMPQNGPPGENGLTYMFDHKGLRFVALDGYKMKKVAAVRGWVNQRWLDSVLADGERRNAFVFSHTPAFKVGTHHESPFPNLYSHAQKRDILWKSFKRGGVLAYFCGHIHFYCRGAVDGIEQVVVGNGGADVVAYSPGKTDRRIAMHYPAEPMPAADVMPGYIVMTVDEGARKINGAQKLWDAQKGIWVRGDIFTLEPRR